MNQEHFDTLKQGVVVWNKWRKENPDVWADLREADLARANLREADLTGAKNIIKIDNVGSRGDSLIIVRGGRNEIFTGCFGGTRDEFITAVAKKPVSDISRLEYEALIPFVRAWLTSFKGAE